MKSNGILRIVVFLSHELIIINLKLLMVLTTIAAIGFETWVFFIVLICTYFGPFHDTVSTLEKMKE